MCEGFGAELCLTVGSVVCGWWKSGKLRLDLKYGISPCLGIQISYLIEKKNEETGIRGTMKFGNNYIFSMNKMHDTDKEYEVWLWKMEEKCLYNWVTNLINSKYRALRNKGLDGVASC